GAHMPELNLSTAPGLPNHSPGPVWPFRIVPYGATSSAGTWYVYNQIGDDLVVSGSIQAMGGGGPFVRQSVPQPGGSQPAWGPAAGGFNLGGSAGVVAGGPGRTARRPARRRPAAAGARIPPH